MKGNPVKRITLRGIPAGAFWLALIFGPLRASAAPVMGELFDLRQPDGSLVPVRIWGDEFYRVVESLDGYTLVRDAEDRPDLLRGAFF